MYHSSWLYGYIFCSIKYASVLKLLLHKKVSKYINRSKRYISITEASLSVIYHAIFPTNLESWQSSNFY